MLRQATLAEVEFRISEVAGWVYEFVAQGDAYKAGWYARELVRLSRFLAPGVPVASWVHDGGN